ncbi:MULTISPECIES: nuclease-related domain-containing protein [unclassified Bacillus (in: firmicutes)]|uniref:nuclease-related domain-containing protein n=1 Tax=unclassified Bacillus (in: firmicutes) TaxID=185979 RepID=UPI0015870370|nr:MULTISPECIES: nuclease-related domain-containing protein [unclassified Bacillus (in: firmicutes)]
MPQSHPKKAKIERDFLKRKAGFEGELKLDYPFSLLDEEKYDILLDLRLPFKEHFFQIDALILTKSYFLNVEVKNISGILTFDPYFKQFLRNYRGDEDAFRNAVSQAAQQTLQLRKYIPQLNYPGEFVVVNANSNSIFRTTKETKSLDKKVCPIGSLLDLIYEMDTQFTEVMDKKEIKKITKRLLKAHTPRENKILDSYGIKPDEIITGVQCSKCKKIPMKYIKGFWVCYQCANQNRDGHVQAVIDYFLLMGNSINNSQFRNFMQLPSAIIATNLLQKLSLKSTGVNKGRTYTYCFETKKGVTY